MASLPIAVNKGGVEYVIVPTNVSFKDYEVVTSFKKAYNDTRGIWKRAFQPRALYSAARPRSSCIS